MPANANPSTSQALTGRGYPTQHSLSSPSIPAALTIGEIKDTLDDEHQLEKGNISPPRHGSAKFILFPLKYYFGKNYKNYRRRYHKTI